MPFQHEPLDNQVTDWHNQLRAALVEKGMWSKSTMVTGRRAFMAIRKRFSAETVDKVLGWYCIHAGEDFVPRASSSKSFADKFDDIARAMAKSLILDGEAEHLCEQAKRLLVVYSQYDWPPEVRSHLGAIIQQSIDNWERFIPKLKQHAEPGSFPHWLLFSQRGFVEFSWLNLLVEQVGWMTHYNGNPMELAFRPDSKRFLESCWRAWSQEWCGKDKLHDALLKRMCK